MDKFAIIGVAIGFIALVGGMVLKGTNPEVLLNPAAAMIILVGTFAAVMNSFPENEFKGLMGVVNKVFKNSSNQDPIEIVKQMMELSQAARRDGLLSMEPMIEQFDNKLMQRGLRMAVDGAEQDFIREVLNNEIDAMEERHRAGALLFTSAGSYAPTLGVLGAVVGLIGALGNLNDMEKLGHMIAAAFVATLYGIFLGYVICHPFATRLKRKSHHELEGYRLIVEGILSIQTGESPNNIKEKLVGLLPPKEREELEKKLGEGAE